MKFVIDTHAFLTKIESNFQCGTKYGVMSKPGSVETDDALFVISHGVFGKIHLNVNETLFQPLGKPKYDSIYNEKDHFLFQN